MIEKTRTCLDCGSPLQAFVAHDPDLLEVFIDDDHFTVYHCQSCEKSKVEHDRDSRGEVLIIDEIL